MSGISSRSRHVATAAVLCAGYALNLWMTNVLREGAGGVDTIWTANAFVIGAMLLLPTRWTAPCLAVGFVVQSAVILLFDHPLFDAVGYSVLNVVEALAVVFLARRANAARLTTPGRFASLIFGALLPVLIIGTGLLGLVIMGMTGAFPTQMILGRLAAKFLGMSLVLPAILLLGRPGQAAPMPARAWELPTALVLVAGLASLIFTPDGAIALLFMFPAFTLLGLRMGPRMVTLAMVLICGVILSLGIYHGPPALIGEQAAPSRQIAAMQVYLAVVFATGIITALMATHQQRLRQLVVARSTGDRRARRRAEAASIAKTDFLATMSHEIRTPLNSIIGFAQVLDLRQDLPGDSRHQVGLIKRSGNALLTVVNDILDFSKVEAGRIELDPKPVDLTAACQDALSIVAETAARKGLALTMTVEGDIQTAHVCDDHRLCQVLLNFLNNAVKFTDAGGVALTLAVEPLGDMDRVRISIADTGVGIGPEAVAGLFQRFSQGDSSVSRNHGGTGLGLAICRGLIEAMDGRVGVQSTLGEGSTFWLEVPLPRAAPVVQAESDTGEDAALSAHILLVDDHPVNRELGVTILGILGCTVDVACDGREAIEAAQIRRYDAILMDVHMPGVDGLAATRAIRALPGAVSRTPIIAMSADVLPEQRARMRAAGMVDSVGKPVEIEDLHACLVRWVGRDATGEVVAA
ncbi:MAG: response regulator [Alphaproteobacteria bacterium]|nr:response regulator [Alphaproteobacteria bacterium]MBU1513078.1 response regulator [Alphaproteobacteria bacterium]MBU2095186.1 response regulator [Alphaproteobacteria bacterium]MBU2150655.1 response regulator [Alphaproteobacteria bacterium]MBU2306086.1 response regulator [Alphaproteobacteria bacterium]